MDMAKPIIRFKGYQDDWEQRKLSELLVERNVQHSQSEEFPLVSFTVENGVTPKTERYEREQLVRGDKSAKKYKETRLDDIVYNPANLKFGAISRNKLGNAVFSPIYVTFEVKKDLVKPSFIEMVVTRKNFIQKALQYQQGTVYERMAVNTEDFTNLDVYIPNGFEQEKIGNYFENLDHLITLHQRKCDETKRLKKYMLQKMFPQNGEKVPEIRFSGFTDDWEQRKFGEIVEKYEDPVETPTEGYTRLGIRSHAKGTFHSFVEKGKELETAKMFRVAADKFIVNITFGWEHAVAITDENDAGKLVSHRFPQYSFNAGMVPKFFRYLILDENFKHHLELSSPGGAGRNRVLKLSDMLEYKMNFPSEAEQKKIAAYFDDLDHLITLHQRELENLQNIKKFMLGKMFV